MLTKTPLRYPGGKSLMTPLFVDMFEINHLEHVTYAEPYAGGAGTAINLLVDEKVDRILINDANIGVFSFWNSILHHTDAFIDRIQSVSLTLEEWRTQHELLCSATQPSFDLGFATFYLSRTNRSGILNAGPIGGSSEEMQSKAKYKLDCRFNKTDLIQKIVNIANRKKQIVVTHKDAIKFLKDLKGRNTFVYLDPPYYVNGKSLYLDYYRAEDHLQLANYLTSTNKIMWVLSYDNVSEIRDLYAEYDLYEFDLKYTANIKKYGSELLTYSKNLILPKKCEIRRSERNLILKKIEFAKEDICQENRSAIISGLW